MFDGTKRTRQNEVIPTDYLFWGSNRILTAESWSDVHLPASHPSYGDLLLVDNKKNFVDLGAYIDVVAEDVLFTGASSRTFDPARGAYLTTLVGPYAGVLAVRDERSSPTNMPVPNVILVRAKTAGQAQLLTKLRMVTAKRGDGIVQINDGVTGAYNIDIYVRSDYVRRMTCDIVSRVHKGLRRVAAPFIGRTMDPLLVNALRDATSQYLSEQIEKGYLLSAPFRLKISPEDRILSQAFIALDLTVPGELKNLYIDTSLVPAQDTVVLTG